MIHCTATPEGREVTHQDIVQWHLKERGWSRVGYSDLIELDGTCVNMQPYNGDDIVDPWEITNGAKGYNGVSRHIVYAGGCANTASLRPKDTRTKAQLKTMTDYVRNVVRIYPHIKIIGHNQIANKACPSFDVPNWLRSIGINPKNIGL